MYGEHCPRLLPRERVISDRCFLRRHFHEHKCDCTNKKPGEGPDGWASSISLPHGLGMKALPLRPSWRSCAKLVGSETDYRSSCPGLSPGCLFRLSVPGIPDTFGTCADPDFLLIFAAAMRPRRRVLSYYGIFGKWNLRGRVCRRHFRHA